MKKNKIVIITLILGILFLTCYLYNSYATSTGVSLGNDENTYDILLNDSTDTVSVPAKSSKTIYYQFSNTNKGTIKYHIGYTSDNVIAKVWWDSEDTISGTIEYGEYKFIKLKLINDTTEDDTITIKPVLGYVNGGDVIPDSNTTLVTGTINETNTMSIAPETALTTLGIDKANVKELSFLDDNIVPNGVLGSTNMNDDSTIKLWYTNSDTSGLYNVYIGSDNGITGFPSDSSYYLANFTNLTNIVLKNIDTSDVNNMFGMFYNCVMLTNLDLGNFNTSNVTRMDSMFSDCKKIKSLDLSSFDTSKVTRMDSMFNHCRELISLDVRNIDTSLVTTMEYMFNQCRNLSFLDVSNFDTRYVTTMFGMFNDCSNLEYLDLSHFDTSLVTDMSNMFYGCQELKILNLSNFNTKKVKTMKDMFRLCRNLIYLNLNSFDTSLVTDMSEMFYDCKKIENLDLSSFNTSSVNNMSYMFYGCNQLKSVDLSNAKIHNVTDMSSMFNGDIVLTNIDMRNADFTNTSNNTSLFTDVPTNVKIYLKDTEFNRDFMSNNYSTYTNVQYIPSS